MVAITLVLLAILILKSLWIDPVSNLEGDMDKYSQFALEVGPKVHNSIFLKPPLIVYRVISVKQGEEEANTTILYKLNHEGEYLTEEIQGSYSAKVRVYFLGIFPYRDIQIKGGLNDGN